MRQYVLFSLALACYFLGQSQKSIERTLDRFNSGSVPYITVKQLKSETNSILLDTRNKEEFEVSHLLDAQWVGFKEFDIDKIRREIPDTTTPVIVYCSIGVRSEEIGEKLQKAGYSNIKNLYGGIFEWKNQGNAVVDSTKQPTERVHAFSKHWGKLLTKGDKIYSLKK
ncbi:MAG: rhodanese-like domain-containing protein [Bacteroidota bacterium]